MNHVMHLGYGDESNWGALVLRPDGTRVCVLEQAVDLAAERLEELCKRIEAELIELSSLPTRSISDRYKVVEPRAKEYPRPQEKLQPDAKNTNGVAPKRSAPHRQSVGGSAPPCRFKQNALK